MGNRSTWAKKQLKRLFEFEGDALDIIAIHEAALEMTLLSPLIDFQENRKIRISKKIRETECEENGIGISRTGERVSVKSTENLSTEGFIYVIKSAKSRYKIGRARNVEHRLDCLQSGTPEKLKLILKVKTSNSCVLEKLCHRKFADKRIRGEWFKLTINDLKWLKNLPAT